MRGLRGTREKILQLKKDGKPSGVNWHPPGQIISFLWERGSNAEWGLEKILTKKHHTHVREKGGFYHGRRNLQAE